MNLAAFGTQNFLTFLLVLVRTAGIFTQTPIFGASQMPARTRLVISLGMALVFTPMVHAAELPTEFLHLALMVLREACIGLIIGFACTLVLSAIEMAGQFVDMQSGFSFASMLDPVFGTQAAIAVRFNHIFAGLLFFAVNAHHVVIQGLAASFRIAPIGEMGLNAQVAVGAMTLFSTLFAIAVRIAAPVVAVVFLADLSLAIVSRVVPQMNVLAAGFPLKLGVGMLGMALTVSLLAVTSQNLFVSIYDHTMGLLSLAVR
ncbi:MAG: flagellar biosynthetic protein FliR [Armatimonadota bacterium]